LQLNSSKIWQKRKYPISDLQKLRRDQNANVLAEIGLRVMCPTGNNLEDS